MRYPPSFLDRLRTATTLSELIGRAIPLKQRGREHMGLCPFHGEKTPSFTVNNEKGFYHCFGCGAHGDAIGFIKDYEKLSYPEAVEQLARETGIPLPQNSRNDTAIIQQEERLFAAVEAAERWFMNTLHAPTMTAGREYASNRGLQPETLLEFGVGCVPNVRDGMYTHLKARGFTDRELVQAGLSVKPESGNMYDKFRARLMFPIHDSRGRAIAFGGRVIPALQPSDKAPKYLNSPETPLFHKGEVLYNWHRARKPAVAKGNIYVVEGYMDAVAMAQAGFPETVATLGTAMTTAHIKQLWQIVDIPTLCLDGDAAGMRAMHRVTELVLPLLTPGKSVRFALLPSGQDPDDVIRQKGADALRQLLAGSISMADMIWKQVANGLHQSPDALAAAEARLQKQAETIEHSMVKQHYLQYFRQQLRAFRHSKTGTATLAKLNPVPAQMHREVSLPNSEPDQARMLLSLLLFQPALLNTNSVESHIGDMVCNNTALDTLRGALLSIAGDEVPLTKDKVIEVLSAQNLAHIVHSLLESGREHIPKQAQISLEDAKRVWDEWMLSDSLVRLQAEYDAAERALEAGYSEETFERMKELHRQLMELKKARSFAIFNILEE